MTEEEFEDLKKGCYYTHIDDKWADLFTKYNAKNGTQLNPHFRSDQIVILKAIAEKHGFQFQPIDLQKYSPMRTALIALQTYTPPQKQWWLNLNQKYK